MCQGIANEGKASEHHEAADKATEDADDDHLQDRALKEAVLPRVGDECDQENTASWPSNVSRIVAGV